MKSVIIVSGYFDPLHVGHTEYLRKAKDLGGTLVAIVNNDKQAELKKGHSFMSEDDRLEIVRSIKYVDRALKAVDEDSSVCQTLRYLRDEYKWDSLIFAKGGDRHIDEIPEREVCEELGIYIKEGLGKKIRSSSAIVRDEKTKSE